MPITSKYWVRRPSTPGSVNEASIDWPSTGICSMPFTMAGASMPAAARMVGARSMTWWNWSRSPPASVMCRGHETAKPLRVPPKCDATCFIHWNGASRAHAHPTL